MNKKEQRKELELILVKTIEGVLNARNTTAVSKIKKAIQQSSKSVAKKFYKALKTEGKKKIAPAKKNTSKPAKSVPAKAKTKIKK